MNDSSEVEKLQQEIVLLKEKLKKYTAPDRSKTYYQIHKEEILTKKREASTKQDPIISKERRKEINKRAYQKRKEKNKESIEDNILGN